LPNNEIFANAAGTGYGSTTYVNEVNKMQVVKIISFLYHGSMMQTIIIFINICSRDYEPKRAKILFTLCFKEKNKVQSIASTFNI